MQLLLTLPEHVAKQMAIFEVSTFDRQNSAPSEMFKTFTELDTSVRHAVDGRTPAPPGMYKTL